MILRVSQQVLQTAHDLPQKGGGGQKATKVRSTILNIIPVNSVSGLSRMLFSEYVYTLYDPSCQHQTKYLNDMNGCITLITCLADLTTISLLQRSHR